jgi:plastocyanin
LGIILAVILLGVGVYLARGKSVNTTPTIQQESTAVEGTNDMTQDNINNNAQETIGIEAGMYYFRPDVIRAKKGEKVKISLTSAGGTHDFVIDEFNARTERAGTGQSTSVEFTPDKTGTFEFYCSVANHRQLGMKGTLIVEE